MNFSLLALSSRGKVFVNINKTALYWAVLLGGLFFPAAAWAESTTVSANISFDTPLSIVKNNDIDFGLVKAQQAGTYTIDTTGSVTPASGGEWIGGTSQAGSLTISGSSTQTIDIAVEGYTADTGVTPSDATCAYNGGTEEACSLSSQAAPGGGKTLLVGVKLTVDGNQTVGATASPSFDVTVTYH